MSIHLKATTGLHFHAFFHILALLFVFIHFKQQTRAFFIPYRFPLGFFGVNSISELTS